MEQLYFQMELCVETLRHVMSRESKQLMQPEHEHRVFQVVRHVGAGLQVSASREGGGAPIGEDGHA